MILLKQRTVYEQTLWGPNTFPTHNKTFELKNQDFLPIHIRLGEMTFFLA